MPDLKRGAQKLLDRMARRQQIAPTKMANIEKTIRAAKEAGHLGREQKE